MVPVGRDVPVAASPIDHGGANVVELAVEPGPHELTLDNKRAALDRQRRARPAEGAAGERRAASGRAHLAQHPEIRPSVDLIHFTILRPPEKQDGTPIRELSLIAFPIRELFDVKIDEFDLIIFDRYRRRTILPATYLENIARYVRKGGALLEAAGPTFGTPLSLYRTPLGAVLPAEPTGNVFEQGFLPRVTDVGRRHPVTAGLPGDIARRQAAPNWGRWFRHVEADAASRRQRHERLSRTSRCWCSTARATGASRSCCPTRCGCGRGDSRAAGRKRSCCAASSIG